MELALQGKCTPCLVCIGIVANRAITYAYAMCQCALPGALMASTCECLQLSYECTCVPPLRGRYIACMLVQVAESWILGWGRGTTVVVCRKVCLCMLVGYGWRLACNVAGKMHCCCST